MASGRTLSTRRLHRHQHVETGQECRRTCEQWIKEGKGAIKWTRLSCRSFATNAVRLQLHALAYNLGNFLRTLATPEPIRDWSLTSLKEKLIKIGAKVVSHGRYVAFQMAEVAIPRILFADILQLGLGAAAATGGRIDVTRSIAMRSIRMTTKPVFSALGAPMSPAGCMGAPMSRNWHCQNP